MTCQHCQTWIGETDHRCPRCGRRARAVPNRISPSTYPIAAAATARAYDFDLQSSPQAAPQTRETPPIVEPSGQQTLFTQPVNGPRVIPFDSYSNARANAVARPAPVQTEKVELARPKAKAHPRRANKNQTSFDLQAAAAAAPKPSIICDAPVAEPAARMKAAAIDAGLMAGGALLFAVILYLCGARLGVDTSALPYLAAGLVTVPFFYKCFWALANTETPGLQWMGLRLVDFDGNPPAAERRYLRAGGSVLSVLAAGIGLLWSLVDEDALTWHDHISGTFPTPAF